MSRGFPVGKFGRRNPRRTNVLERNIPMLGRIIDAAYPNAPKREGGELAADRIAGNDDTAAYLLQRLPREMATLEAERCYTKGRPACKDCPVRYLCQNWRAKNQEHPRPEAPSVLELFCGAGGLSLGFEQAGYRTKLAVDADIDAIHTYRANRPWMKDTEAVCADIQELMANGTFEKLRGQVDGVIGGPPCQTFSLVGFRTKKLTDRHGRIHSDERTWLPIAMARIIRTIQPKFCVMENVAGFMSALNGDVRNQTREIIRSAGYTLVELKVHAEYHGAPQRRARYMLIGLRNDAVGGPRKAWALLQELEGKVNNKDAELKTVAQALAPLARLPSVPPGGGHEYTKVGSLETWNHYARAHNERDKEIYALLKPGETAAELEKRLPATIPYSLEAFHDKYRKLDPQQPSPTIPAHLKKDSNSFVLDGVNRGLTPREAACLQGFPIDYMFVGEQTQQFQQIGNAVAPPVGKAIATLVTEALTKAKDKNWTSPIYGVQGPRPKRRTIMMRQKLWADLHNGGLHTVSEYTVWARLAFQSSNYKVRPLIYNELRRAKTWRVNRPAQP